MPLSKQISDQVEQFGQSHLLDGLDSLSDAQIAAYEKEISQIPFEFIRNLVSPSSQPTTAPAANSISQLQPEDVVRPPRTPADDADWKHATEVGQELLRAGKVAAMLVAGGQGTRLGFDLPKGMFPIGALSGKTLFQLFCEQLGRRGRLANATIPYGVMTSVATHSATETFFVQHANFGLEPGQIQFFQQGGLPSVDAETGEVLLERPGKLVMSPDGHGGMLSAIQNSGFLDRLIDGGIEYLYYHQVDNPAAKLCDPAFLGWHAQKKADVTTKVVAKLSADEKTGVAVRMGGKMEIVEYIDLPSHLAQQKTDSGQLAYWAGNTAMHVFSVAFLKSFIDSGRTLPFHVARKAVPWFDAKTGEMVRPTQPNAFKFERFVFDLLPIAKTAVVFEVLREEEFLPVKNKSGNDSPETVKAAMQARDRRWLYSAGLTDVTVPGVEISPTAAVDADDVAAAVAAGRKLNASGEFLPNQ